MKGKKEEKKCGKCNAKASKKNKEPLLFKIFNVKKRYALVR